ncbi:inner membrane protein YccA [Alcaligenes faecalis subsp. faecalis NCIB 8687]|nr:inner membrane protein YccA [Alcaligenes faecalis subsp. faecalis NCIB 8687]
MIPTVLGALLGLSSGINRVMGASPGLSAIVFLVSWSVGVFGPLIGGALAGLPMVLGPGFYFLSQQFPADYVQQAATSCGQ